MEPLRHVIRAPRKRELVVAVFLGLSIGFPAQSWSGSVKTPGSACHHYNAAQAALVDFFSTSIVNISGNRITIVCPVFRTGARTSGAHVYVDVANSNAADPGITCTAYSKDHTEALLASQALTASVSGAYRFDLNLKGAHNSTKWSTYGVVCSVPATARILDVELAE